MSHAPTSTCGTDCVPAGRSLPRVAPAVAVLRLLSLIVVLLAGIGLAAALPTLGWRRRNRAVRGWFRAVVASTGVRLTVTGATSPTDEALSAGGAVLVTANHLSWLDIPAVLAVQAMRVVAKSDVRGWPVLGFLAARAGTIFIDRRRLRRLPLTVAEIRAVLCGGDSVLVFPEGSTWCGRHGGRFHPAMMQSAIDAATPVRPLILRYLSGDGTVTTVASWVGDDALLASVWRIVRSRGLWVRVEVGPLVETTGRTRREVAAAAQTGRNDPVARAERTGRNAPVARAERTGQGGGGGQGPYAVSRARGSRSVAGRPADLG